MEKLSGAGILVLGMHRSGTSVLTRLLQGAGADVGSRIVGGSTGNDAGHWEDAVAVEVHERLLAAFGTHWDDPYALPDGWQHTGAASRARDEIRQYLRTNRLEQRLWVAKDPRLCLFADLWREAAAGVAAPLSAVVALRHPLEVASSLHARDGIAMGRGLLLWMEYTQAAFEHAARLPNVVVDYATLLSDWRACLARIRTLPGADILALGDAAGREVDGYVSGSMRHHVASDDALLPPAVRTLWERVSGAALRGSVGSGDVEDLGTTADAMRDLLQPVMEEARVSQRRLWERVGRAEASMGNVLQHAAALPDELTELRQRMDKHTASVIEAVSSLAAGVGGMPVAIRQVQDQLESHAGLFTDRLSAVDAHARDLRGAIDNALATTDRAMRGMQESTVTRIASLEATVQQVGQAMSREESLRESMAALALELDASRRDAGILTRELDASRHDAGILTRELDASRRDVEILTRELDASRRDAEILTRELDASRRDVGNLTRELDDNRRHAVRSTHELERLREVEALFERVKASRSWRWTRPWRVLRRLLSHQGRASVFAKLRGTVAAGVGDLPLIPASRRVEMVQRLGAAAERGAVIPFHLAGALRLPEPGAGMADVFVWSVIDWHFRTQRPQHIAKALAEKGHRVFYVSNNFVDSAGPGFAVEQLDDHSRLFQVHLHLEGAPAIYFGMPGQAQLRAMRASLGELLSWTRSRAAVSIVQHPYWLDAAFSVPNSRTVYDCMDHHAGFENNATSVLEAEKTLIADSDLVVVTSGWLEAEVSPHARNSATIRNATEYGFFRDAPADVYANAEGRRVAGYFGAIAEWFDVELVRAVALACPDAEILVVGADTVGAADELSGLGNVRFVGEVPYSRLPYYLHGFDVCLLPFKVIELTLATNPVKVYEYLSAGKPVVAVALPEMTQFDGQVDVASDSQGFVSAVRRRLEQGVEDAQVVAARRAFASRQTWSHRAEELVTALAGIREPKVSVIVLTYNNLAFTQACLHSIERHSDYPNLEVIVVDNASTDGSRDWLREWAAGAAVAGQRVLILNESNLGFSAGNNVGLRAATGDVLVILNNDTFVTPGWVRTLSAHLRRDLSVGLVGPVTNNIGNEARIELHYSTMEEMVSEAARYTLRHPGERLSMATAAFFCVGMRRDVYEKVGDMDEDFGVGFFEDDDYCRRVERAGYRIVCAEDVFVHHHLSASFDQLKAEAKQQLFERNRRIYEAKWGPWSPHRYRQESLP